MTTSPQPPHPPAAPGPPHTGSNVLAIVLLILAMIVAASVAAVWFGVRLLQQNVHVQVTEKGGNRKEVNIKTPIGNFEVHKGEQATEAQLGLPFYPGAARVNEKDDNGSVGLSFNLPDQNDVRIYVAKFQSSDPLGKVRDFYGQRLGSEVTQYTVKNREGKTIVKLDRLDESNFKVAADKLAAKDEGKTTFEIKEKHEERVVALEPKDGGTRITLVRVLHAKAEPD
jgi:hypothetical protein